MTNYVNFQTRITTIMEVMTKSAIAEMTKLFDDTSTVLCSKISKSLNENEALRKKLQLLQQELRTSREQKQGITGAHEHPVNVRSVGVQVLENKVEEPSRERTFGQGRSFSLRRDGERPGVEQSADMEKFKPEPVLIKQERLEEVLCHRNPQPTPGGQRQVTHPLTGGEEQITQPTPVTEEPVTQPIPVEDGRKWDIELTSVGDPEELSEQHRRERGDEELSGLEFVVKAEQEEDCLAQGLNNLGSEYVMYERDSQLWTSCAQEDNDIGVDYPVCSNATDQFSQNLSIHTQLKHTSATIEFSGYTPSSFGPSYVEEFDKMSEKPSVCSEELRSEAIHTQQGQYRERLVHTVERENQTLLPQQQPQQHGPSVKHMIGSERPAQPHSGSQYETGSTLSTSAFNAGNTGKTDGQAHFRKKPFACVYCGKTFDCSSSLTSHHRIHTGEKPFSCTQCGRCFNHKSNLAQHERIHSGFKPISCALCGKRFARGPDLRRHHRSHTGERPYHCAQCGKRFAREANLRAHQRSHSGERPFPCTQCGRRFTRQSNLLVHQRIHTRVKPYS